VKAMMKDSGMALMGCGTGSGPNRIEKAVKEAFESPLLNDFDLKSAKKVLVNITGGKNDKGLTMDDMKKINSLIDEYTGGGNNFKRGLIWDDDPKIEDTIHITSIVTGLDFKDVIGPGLSDADNYISIDKKYTYDKGELAKGEGITLPADSSSHIGYSSKDNQRVFHYDADKKPALLVSYGQDISILENEPAIRRKPKKTE